MRSRRLYLLAVRPSTVALCALCLLLPAARAGVVAHWTFDAPNPDGSYPDEASAHPATPKDKNAITAYSGSAPAPFGRAITFRGSNNGYLTIPPLTNIQKTSFTVAAWVNFATPGPNFILADWQNSAQAGFVFGVDPLKDKSKAEPIVDLASAEAARGRGNTPGNRLSVVRLPVTAKTVPLNEWHHLAWIWDRDSQTVTCFLDGDSVGEQKRQGASGLARSADLAVNNRPMFIGARELPNAGSRNPVVFNGSLDELWIFDQALTPIQLRNLIAANDIRGNAPVATSPAGPPEPVTPSGSVSTPAGHNPSTPALGVSSRRISPFRITGIVACLAVIVTMSCYLIWAVMERGKLRALGKL